MIKAKQRLYLTADKKRLVAEGDKRAAFLYCTPGDEIPVSAAEQFGLKDGALPEKGKSSVPPVKPAGQGNGDDLTSIKGIGGSSAKALIAAGIDSFAKLAEIDPENPPEVEGLGARSNWAAWVKAAGQVHAGDT